MPKDSKRRSSLSTSQACEVEGKTERTVQSYGRDSASLPPCSRTNLATAASRM